jgi:D-alanyl-D-alanine-carboxypeptidase/D-alanyl-D-alanine-endopeptidase
MQGVERLLLSGALCPAILLLLPTTARAQHFPPDEEVQPVLQYLVEDGKANGIVVGFLEADGTARILSYGDPGPYGEPLGPQSVFEMGSIGKTFTATILSDMVLRGEVGLEDPLSDHLPDSVRVPSFEGREITLLDLATHRSGLPKNADTHRPADPENPWADFTVGTLYDFLASYELRRRPGTEFEYSNLGFQLLGQALAHVAGTSYAELLRERILTPLGMTSAGFTLNGETAIWAVQGYRNGSPVLHWTGTDARLGAGGLLASMNDMLEYLKANVGPPETELEQAMRAAQEPRLPWGGTGAQIGLAWRVDSIQGRRIVQHAGNTSGFSALIAFDPKEEVGLVWLTNTYAFSDPTPLELLVYGRRPRQQEMRISPEMLASFAGQYRDPSGSFLFVRLEPEGHLTLQATRGARVRMYAASDSSFTLARGPTRVVFERTERGEVSALRLEGNASAATARKVGDESPSPRAVAAGTGWYQIGFRWKPGYWGLVGGPILLALITLGAEVRRRSRKGIRPQS